MTEELRKCPFCGEKDIIIDVDEHTDSVYRRYLCECSRCLASTKSEKTEELAAENWNARAPKEPGKTMKEYSSEYRRLNRKKYNAYHKEYQRKLRKRKRNE